MATTSAESRPSRGRAWILVGAALIALQVVALQDFGRGQGFSDWINEVTIVFSVVLLALVTWLVLVVYGKAPGSARGLVIALTVMAVPELLVNYFYGFVATLGVVALWIGLGRSPSAPKLARVEELAASREQQAHAQRVRQIQEWERAYRDAHGGAEPPAGFMPPIAVASGPAAGTANTFAILALIFGFLGGLIAIPFGFVALSQVRKTGQSGRGMAIAGIILGLVWIAASVILFVVAATSGSGY